MERTREIGRVSTVNVALFLNLHIRASTLKLVFYFMYLSDKLCFEYYILTTNIYQFFIETIRPQNERI